MSRSGRVYRARRCSRVPSARPPARWVSILSVVMKSTSWPRRQASWARGCAKWLLPTPVGPNTRTLSWRSMSSQDARGEKLAFFSLGLKLEAKRARGVVGSEAARRGRGGRGPRGEAGQGLAMEGMDEDGLDGVVAIFAAGVGPRARGVDTRRAEALGEPQDALGAPQAIEGAVPEQGVDEECTGGADLGSTLVTPRGRLQEEVDFLGWQVGDEGAPLAGPRPAMGGDEDVLVEELNLAAGRAHPEVLADQAMRPGVVGPAEDDVAVGMKLGLLPLGQLPGRERQRAQRRPLDLVEDLERNPLGGPVEAAAGDLHAPAQEMAIAVVHVAEGAAGQGVALGVVNPALFHLAFVLGRPWRTGRGGEAVVLGALAIAALDLRIVEGGVHDGGAEIIEHDAAWNAPEELERRAMQAEPRGDRMIEHDLGVLVAAEGQRHHEDPGPADPPALGIEELAGEAEVDLSLVARPHFQAERGPARAWRQPTQEALHRGVAAGEAVLLDEKLPDGLAFDPALVQGEHALAQRLHERLLMGRPLGWGRLQQAGERGRVRRRAAREHAMPRGPHAVMGDGVTADAEGPGDPAVRLAPLQPAENRTGVRHRTPPARTCGTPRER